MASGHARGAKARGKRIAFGDGEKIRWHPYAERIFRHNPNVAPPGSEGDADIEWIANYAGKRPYNQVFGNRWLWIPGHGNRPGEILLEPEELKFAGKQGRGFVLIEPNVPAFKSVAFNKQWPKQRYEAVACELASKTNLEIVQFEYGPPHGPTYPMQGVRRIKAPDFRTALAVLARAALFVGPEGGLHHGAAAVGVPAVVIFGGFISPCITGYQAHANIFAGGEACGSLTPCQHCRKAMDGITVEQVYKAAMEQLSKREHEGKAVGA